MLNVFELIADIARPQTVTQDQCDNCQTYHPKLIQTEQGRFCSKTCIKQFNKVMNKAEEICIDDDSVQDYYNREQENN